MKESEIENLLVWHVERLGGKSWKFASPNQRGVADRIVCLPNGQTWFIELKRPKGGRLSPMQKIFADAVTQLNQNYACLWNEEQINEWVKNIAD